MKKCMNKKCGTTSYGELKTGWSLRSGDIALLCLKCGYAFDQHIYCEEFHTDESGWRQCDTCGKRLHCGCIASLSLIELLDDGGVKCVSCARNSDPNSSSNGGKSTRYGLCNVSGNNLGIDNHKDNHGSNQPLMPNNLDANVSLGLPKQENLIFPTAETRATTPSPPPISMDTAVKCGAWRGESTWASSLAQPSTGSFMKDRLDISNSNMQNIEHYESVAHPNLNISLSILSGNLQFSSGTVTDEREQIKMSNVFNQGFASPRLVPTPPKLPFPPAADANMNMMPQLRLARPPGEGRGRHQLLPRYWPRITDQELQQISGDSKCTIIPLFEKVLSASDAGRIGRLVLPKACAEAYFPPISQPEGLPIKIQDVKGNEWVFQFRFWPNNNSRMYVLEGVTPCIQSMQLQAGDTVTFSRKDPEGKLVMGFRKASNSSMQNPPVANGCSGFPHSMKGSTDTHMNALSRQLDSAGGNFNLQNIENVGESTEEGLLPSSTKKGRNIGAKSKRLLIDNQDSQAMRLTWEEVQSMVRPPLNATPSVVVIEDFEFEEFEEPPVFGKSSVFATRSPGVIEQWAQCDSCSKWRRLPADYLLPPKWTCMDNAWDPIRCFCAAPDELSPRELKIFLNVNKDSTKKRMTMANKVGQERESCGLSALANAAVLGDNPNEPGTLAVATTTKHPRHRAGCSCIVCIQPPSGKGKHNSACTCTVCMTVKRRFKTLMMRKKKRQSDQEAAQLVLKTGHTDKCIQKDDKVDDIVVDQNIMAELGDCCSGLDLNCHPELEVDLKTQDDRGNGPSVSTPEEQVEETEGQRVEEPIVSPSLQEQVLPIDGSCEPENTNKSTDSR